MNTICKIGTHDGVFHADEVLARDADLCGMERRKNAAQKFNKNSAQPIRQRAGVAQRQARDIGPQPVGQRAIGHGQHHAKTRRLLTPYAAPCQAGDDVQQSHQNQITAWQARSVLLIQTQGIGGFRRHVYRASLW